MAGPQGDIDSDDDVFGPPDRLAAMVRAALDRGDGAALAQALDPMHAADVADLLEQVEPRERRAILALWHGGMDGELLSELDESLRDEVIDSLAPADLARAVAGLESDDVVDLVETLDDAAQGAVMDALPAPERLAVERALGFPEGSAGRLMQSEVVRAPAHWTVGEAIDFLRSGIHLPDQFYHIVLVDPAMRPKAQVTLGRILSSDRTTPLATLAEQDFRSFSVEDDAAEVARAFNQYHLISAPVTDAGGRLVGTITIDDAMIVLDEEHEEDILRLAGVGDSAISDRVIDTLRRRLPWLAINMVTASLAALVISRFAATIEALVVLAALMPIVASMGGNAGTQSLTVAVRALATRELTQTNRWRVIRREALVGLANGVVLAALLGAATALIFGAPLLGAVIAAALVVNLCVASLAGTLVPILLDRAGLDPALASGTFVTTMTDVTGFFAFLGLASLVLT